VAGTKDPLGLATGPHTTLRDKMPTGGVPTRCAGSRCARAGWTFHAGRVQISFWWEGQPQL